MSHVNKVIDADPHFVIDINTRNIKNVSQTKVSLVQYDHNSERFSFTLPRFIEGHDMLECNSVQVHYYSTANPDTKGVYAVTDLAVCEEDAENVCCTWLISRNVTQTAGALLFQLRFACVDEDGTEEYAWHTNPFRGISVSAGMNNAEAVVEQYADILEQWYVQLFSTTEEGIRNINTAKVDALNTIKNATYNMANAFKGNAVGNNVVLDDISPIEHPVGVKVQSKNIYPFSLKKTSFQKASVIRNDTDNEITIKGDSGTAYMNSSGWWIFYKEGQYNTGLIDFTKDVVTVSMEITLVEEGIHGATFRFAPTSVTGGVTYTATTTPTRYSFTMSVSTLTSTGLYLTLNGNTLKIANVQFEYGETATDYTPYTEEVSGVGVGVNYPDGSYDEFLPQDGTLEVTSSYPTMHMFALDAGVALDVTYNRDINKAFTELEEKLTTAIISLGGNV